MFTWQDVREAEAQARAAKAVADMWAVAERKTRAAFNMEDMRALGADAIGPMLDGPRPGRTPTLEQWRTLAMVAAAVAAIEAVVIFFLTIGVM